MEFANKYPKTKMINKKLFFAYVAVCLIVNVAVASAEENKQANVLTVATVNIYNATLLSQSSSGEFTIAFDLNNREGVQSNIKYSVSLAQKVGEKNIVLDKKVYDEELILQQGETVQKKISYIPPRFLNGAYLLALEARNSEGLFLGMANIGKVALKGNGQNVVIYQNSCYLSIKEDEKETKYELEQGLNIKPENNITLNCEIENKIGKDVSVKPSIATYYRSVFGKTLSEQTSDSFVLKNGEKTLKSFSIPKQTEPQAYEAVFCFLDENSSFISEKIGINYTIAGKGATVQNVKFDKNFYQKGETAKVSFFYLDLANNFADKNNIQQQGTFNVEIKIDDQNSEQCAPLFSEKLTTEAFNIFDIAITKNCINPTADVAIKDDEGKVLARVLFETSNESKSQQTPIDTKNSPNELRIASNSILLGTSILALVVFVLVAIFFRKRKNGRVMIWLLGFVFAGIAWGGCAKGDTFTTRNGFHVFTYPVGAIGGWANITWNVSLNKTQFLTNESMIVSSHVSSPLPFSLLIGRSIALDGNINGVTERIGTVSSGSSFVFPAANWNAQSSAGSYNAEFMMSSSFDGTSRFYIPYTVIGATVNGACGISSNEFTPPGGPFPSGTLAASEPTLCQFGNVINFSGLGPWSWTCQGSGMGHVDASCNANVTCTPNYIYTCNNPIPNCAGHEGETITGPVDCTQFDGTGCDPTPDIVTPSNSATYCGASCVAQTINCPAVSKGNYREVAP